MQILYSCAHPAIKWNMLHSKSINGATRSYRSFPTKLIVWFYISLGKIAKPLCKRAALFKALILQNGKILSLSTMSDAQRDTSPKCSLIPGISFPGPLWNSTSSHLLQHTQPFADLSDIKTTLLSSLWCPRTTAPWTDREPQPLNTKTLPNKLVVPTCCHSEPTLWSG